MRYAEINRDTSETCIFLSIDLDGRGKSDISTGIGFLDHMLTLFAKHGLFDLTVKCTGDTWVDDHHSAEDIGIALGLAFSRAIGDGRGICRYGDAIIPMDEALVLTAADISGRACLGFDLQLKAEKVGTFDTELVREFFEAFIRSSAVTLHIRQLAGENTHHIIEAVFKSWARSLRKAVERDERAPEDIPSTKGVL